MVLKLYQLWLETTPGILASYKSVFSEVQRTASSQTDFKPLNFEVKRAIRTLLVAAEAMSGFMTDCVKHFHWLVGADVPKKVSERLKAAERSNLRPGKGRRYLHLGPDERTKLALKYFPRLFDISTEPQFRAEWQQFRSLQVIRNGFTHPGTALDLLGARGLPTLIAPAIWLIEQFGRVIVECGRVAGLQIPGEVRLGGAASLPKWSMDLKNEPERLFNEEFNSLVASSGARSIALLRFYLDITHYEFTRAVDDLRRVERRKKRNKIESRLTVRDFIQTVSASGEATLGFLLFFLRSARNRCEIIVRQKTLRRLSHGEDVGSRLVETVNLFSSKIGDGSRVSESEGLSDYRATLEVRDRLTHPRSVEDLAVSDDELRRAKLAWCWLADVRGLLTIRADYSIWDRLRFWS